MSGGHLLCADRSGTKTYCAERKMTLGRPAAGGESRHEGFFIIILISGKAGRKSQCCDKDSCLFLFLL